MVQLEAVFYMFCAFVLLWGCFYLLRRLGSEQMSASSNERILAHATQSIIDMGFQLYNLTRVTDNSAPGYVYVVKSDTGHYKIGRTNNPTDRRKTFNVKMPVEIEFIVLIKTGNMNYLENTFHRMFGHKRVNGEWFKLDRHDLQWLKSYPGNTLNTDATLAA